MLVFGWLLWSCRDVCRRQIKRDGTPACFETARGKLSTRFAGDFVRLGRLALRPMNSQAAEALIDDQFRAIPR